MQLVVTQAHIDRAELLRERKTPAATCPIDLALQDLGLKGVGVSFGFAWDNDNEYELGRDAIGFAHCFDFRGPVGPREFTLHRRPRPFPLMEEKPEPPTPTRQPIPQRKEIPDEEPLPLAA